ncbi:MAG: DUF389 domain-containing protein [Bacteroidia bacterium]
MEQIDFAKATANIRKEVSFQGFNIWILICSILICSLGLNLNSTAIIIGAMLISPLMGPINGLGLAVGTYDRKLLRKSLLNLGVATVVSILTATIFFKITPTADNLHELFSRKRPIVLDLFVAFFGGVAGILAASRCINNNVVPGVAIATALMPPLCTAGYGLATWQMDYFLGAFYLFFMNCVMIGLAAALFVFYLKYPKYSFVDEQTKRKVKNGIVAFVAIVSIPSIIVYYQVLMDSIADDRVHNFIEQEFKSNKSIYVTNYERTETDSGNQIKVILNGQYMEESVIHLLESRLDNYKLNDYKLVVYQNESSVDESDLHLIGQQFKVDLLADLYEKNEQQLQNKEDEIAFLKSELRRIKLNDITSDKLMELSRSQFDVEQMAVDNVVYVNTEGKDTIPTVLVRWDENLSQEDKKVQYEKMVKLLQVQLDRKDIVIHELN